jgi:hypothetical protein
MRPTAAGPAPGAGPVDPTSGETWESINSALRGGLRGLVGRTSLARLLLEHRGPDAHNRPPRLTVEQVLAWADAYRAASGRWPRRDSGAVVEGSRETWSKIAQALAKGQRGLPGGLSLAGFLAAHRPVG